MAKKPITPVPAAPAVPPEPMLSTHDVARRYGVSDETVRRWCRKGIIAYVMVGPYRMKRIAKSEAERHFQSVDGAAT